MSQTSITIAPHPLLHAGIFASIYPRPLGEIPSPGWLLDLLRIDAAAPVERSEATRSAVRDLLRHGGYKPTGRGKPASEYLLRAATEGSLGSINAAVDACNVVSLHSGLPISMIDLDRVSPPLHIAVAPDGASYVFNASGQEIDLSGLLSLFDSDGPIANAVKDGQRTKTNEATTRTLSVIWGIASNKTLVEQALAWYREIVERLGAQVEESSVEGGGIA
jgi:DNA/RNA-binding domain of Phe-tRNA-synthetase-like protein